MEPNRSKGKSDYSLTSTSLGFLASKRITIKDRLWLFLDLLASYPHPVFQLWSFTGTKTRVVLLEAPFALEGTGSSVPVTLLHKYLHFSPFAQLPFSQIYANCSKTEAFGAVQDELGKARSPRWGDPSRVESCCSHPMDFGGARISPGYLVLPCQFQHSHWSLVGLTPTLFTTKAFRFSCTGSM